jgi:ABC-type sugar transport system ATPase subunit
VTRRDGLELRRVVKRFGDVTVVQALDLAVAEGEFVVLLGESGCGKSTTLRMVAGLEAVTEGEVMIGGRNVTHAPPMSRDIAMVFQNYALYPHMSVAQNMGFALDLAGRSAAEIAQKVTSAAKVLNIEHLLQRKPKELSGGQRQRVAIGRAIVREPKVFLFDEPLSNLDAKLRGHMRAELALLHRRLGKSTLYVTHDQVEAMTLADRIAIFDKGRIQQVGTPDEVFNRPATLFVAGFIGTPAMNLLPVRFVNDAAFGDLQGDGFTLPAPQWLRARLTADSAINGESLTLGVRPQALSPAHEVAGAVLSMRVEIAEYHGTESQLVGRLIGSDAQRLTATWAGDARARLHDTIHLHTLADDMHVFDNASGLALRT